MTTIRVEPLHDRFAAEVHGVDPTRPLDDADFDTVRDALDRHSVLVLRDQRLDDDALIGFARRFGPLHSTRKGAVGEGSLLVVLTNLDAEGNLLEATHKQLVDAKANQLWHSDASFRPVPAYASLLSGRRVATRGGETEFASTRVAYATLDEPTRERIERLEAIHHFAHSRAQIDPNHLSREERDHLPPVRHPLVRRHSHTGEAALYVGSHVREVLGLSAEEGRALVDALLAHATRPECVYAHRWQPDDLVIWDNSAVLHRGRPWEVVEPRHMVRATVADAGYTEGALAA